MDMFKSKNRASDYQKNTPYLTEDQLSLNAGKKYCRILQGEHSAILAPLIIKLPFAIYF